MLYFEYIKRIFFDHLNIRIIIGAAKRGYENLHLINSELITHISPSSDAVMVISDDTCVNYYSWDVAILAMTATNYGQAYIAHPIQNANAYNSNPRCPNNVYFFNMWKFGPHCFHPILSRTLIALLMEATKDREEWTIFGNSMLSDSFFEILERELKKTHKRNILLPCPNLGMLFPQNVATHKEGGGWGDSPVIRRGLAKFMRKETFSIVQEIAAHIANSLGKQ